MSAPGDARSPLAKARGFLPVVELDFELDRHNLALSTAICRASASDLDDLPAPAATGRTVDDVRAPAR